MVPACVVVLLVLVIPVGARAATDEPAVTVDESSASGQPISEPAPPPLPAPPAAQTEPRPVAGTPALRTVAAPHTQSGTGFGLEIGYAQGGDRFVTLFRFDPIGAPESGLNGGDGVSVSLTGSWTPLWREGFGLGVYASAGVKYTDASNYFGSIAFTRYPVAVAAQLLMQVSEKWLLLGRVGPLAEVGAKLSGDGDNARLPTDFATKLGGFADAGVQRALGQHLAITVVVRYTYLDVSYAGSVTSANNLGAGLGFCFSR